MDCATSGNDEEDVILSAGELLGCLLYGLKEDEEDIPDPTQLAQVEVHENERAILIDVYMPSIRLSRITELDHDINFSQLLQEANPIAQR